MGFIMKFWHLIFVAFFANYFPLRKTTECVNLLRNCEGKMRPSFEEIFGKGWDEEQKMDKSSQQNNGQMVEENGEENGTDQKQMNENDKKEAQDKMSDRKRKDRSDQEKRVIIEKFHLIKEKLKEIGKYENRKRAKIEQQIAKQLGVSRDKLYKWKREFGESRKMNKKENNYYLQKKCEFTERLDEFKGMLKEGKQQKIAEELGITARTFQRWKSEMNLGKAKKSFSDQEKRTIIERFHLIKKKLRENGKLENRKKVNFEHQIGRQLGVHRTKIYEWKREFDKHRKSKCYSDWKKREIIQNFGLIREKLKEIGKFPYKKRATIEQQIAKQLGVNREKIYKWKREFGVQRKSKCYSDQQKRAILEKFDLIREKLKEIGKFPYRKRAKIEQQIGNQLGTCRKAIYKWKKELGVKTKNKFYYEEKKREFIERMDEFKGMMEEGKWQKIAKELGIRERTLRKWKRNLG